MAEQATSEPGEAVPPTITYSRAFILSLYQSPLVPAKPHGMKDLAEWFGEFDPPMSPHRQHQTQPASHNATSTSASEGNSSTRAERAARPNPFNTTFGHFGVDGGLTSSNATGAIGIMSGGKEGGKRGQNQRESAPHLHGGSIEKDKSNTRDKERDWENRRGGDGGAGTSPPNTFFERTTRRGGDVTANARESTTTNGRERREEKKEGRAEEGGWRTAGDRDRRLRPTQTNSHSNSYNDQPLRAVNSDSREQRNDRNNNKKSNQPSWMDDDPHGGSASGTPSWMDAPATGGAPSFGATGGNERESSAENGAAPVDSIQAWKQQMKEMEKKERERNAPAPVETAKPETASHVAESAAPPVMSPPIANGPQPDFGIFAAASLPRPSVFENSLPQTSSQEGGGGSRARSRFANKFFNGGEAPPQPTSQKVEPSRGNEASREDLESMNRLMGMLQGSGTRVATDPAPPRIVPYAPPPPPVAAYAPPPPPAAPVAPELPLESRPRQGSASGSRFSFSQSPQPPPARQELPPLSQQQQQFFAAQSGSQQAYLQQQQYPPQDPHRPGLPHSRSSSKINASPPLAHQYQFSANGYSAHQALSRTGPLPPGVTRLPEYTNPPLLPALNAQQQQHYQQQGLVPMGPNSSRPPPQLSPMYAQHSGGNYAQAPPLGMGPRSPYLAPSQQQQPVSGRPLASPNGFAPPPMGYAPQHFPQQQQQFQQQQQRMPPTGPGGYPLPPYQNQPQQGGGGMFGPQVDLMALLNAGGMRNS